MNSKMTTNSQLLTTKPKKQTKQTARTGKKITEMEITWRVFSRGMGGSGRGERYRE